MNFSSPNFDISFESIISLPKYIKQNELPVETAHNIEAQDASAIHCNLFLRRYLRVTYYKLKTHDTLQIQRLFPFSIQYFVGY